MISEKIKNIPLGYSEVVYQNKKYGISRSDFNSGKSIKIFAKELGGNDFISLNFYETNNGEILKPCEMPEEKVIHFLNNFKNISR
ncbi:peptide methionine sulfoxide reductase [Galbibacter sp. BG1]|uniref:peptide methionine sulfoxide reductase n=1 Tax=Galbibacter sp. BG1 TaxID=1170699 RepID=UPI0015BEFBCD|nr:peptide methionine sulfoxide reductase [Galbibacter sp. BG1]QLE01191.1 peptide methionine sulfoxide reductase [Galbibacter sp. BG1]